jgi:hypothetical protein
MNIDILQLSIASQFALPESEDKNQATFVYSPVGVV